MTVEGKSKKKRKARLVECSNCENTFMSRKNRDSFVGYQCFSCAKADWEDYSSSVGLPPGSTIAPFTLESWRFYEADLH